MSLKHTTQSSSALRRKAVSKRLLVHSDDDDDGGGDDDALTASTTKRTKRPRTIDTDASLSVATTPDYDNDMDVDIDTLRDSAQRSLSAADDSRFLPDNPSTADLPLRVDTSKKRKTLTVTMKKSQVPNSDEDAHNSHDPVDDALSDLASPLSEVSDDDFETDIPPKRGASKAKVSVPKTKAGKVKLGQVKGAKEKGFKEKEKDKEILMKDERKSTVPPVPTSRASSAAAQSQPSDLFSNEDPAPSAADPAADTSQPVRDVLSQTIPKKRKLPPIKKTKTTTVTTGTTGTTMTTMTTTTQKAVPPPTQEPAKPSLPVSEQRKQALTGVRDVDLADSKVYAELFKGAGGNTPKSGLKNAEERRKELDRMRDEARARRRDEMKFTFDLQAQADKIARFEQRLRAENSTVLHPNFLAAKFRDEWEMERRARRATPKEEGEA